MKCNCIELHYLIKESTGLGLDAILICETTRLLSIFLSICYQIAVHDTVVLLRIVSCALLHN